MKRKKEGKYQESIQSIITPDIYLCFLIHILIKDEVGAIKPV